MHIQPRKLGKWAGIGCVALATSFMAGLALAQSDNDDPSNRTRISYGMVHQPPSADSDVFGDTPVKPPADTSHSSAPVWHPQRTYDPPRAGSTATAADNGAGDNGAGDNGATLHSAADNSANNNSANNSSATRAAAARAAARRNQRPVHAEGANGAWRNGERRPIHKGVVRSSYTSPDDGDAAQQSPPPAARPRRGAV